MRVLKNWFLLFLDSRYFWVTLILLIALLGAMLSTIPGCAVAPDRINPPASHLWSVTSLGNGAFLEVENATGHVYVILPDGVIDFGTTAKPTFDVTERPDPTTNGKPIKPKGQLI